MTTPKLCPVDDATVERIVRSFWERTYRHRNDYTKKLPDPLPALFLDNMKHALVWLEIEPGEIGRRREAERTRMANALRKADILARFIDDAIVAQQLDGYMHGSIIVARDGYGKRRKYQWSETR